jgi:hypothetical protein
MSESITQEELKKRLSYDPLTGYLTWIAPNTKRWLGKKAGYLCPKDGYILIRIKGRIYPAHRLAMLYMNGVFPTHDTDHKDGVRNNNAYENLRCATRSENNQNQRRPRSDNKSGYLGVYWSKHMNKWASSLTVNGKKYDLGYFEDVKLASEAYLIAKKKYHPMSMIGVKF